MDRYPARSRSWHITLTDGKIVDHAAQRVVITDSGALMLLDDSPHPKQVYAAGSWVSCSAVRG